MVFEARKEVGTRKRTWEMKLEDKNGVKRENTQVQTKVIQRRDPQKDCHIWENILSHDMFHFEKHLAKLSTEPKFLGTTNADGSILQPIKSVVQSEASKPQNLVFFFTFHKCICTREMMIRAIITSTIEQQLPHGISLYSTCANDHVRHYNDFIGDMMTRL